MFRIDQFYLLVSILSLISTALNYIMGYLMESSVALVLCGLFLVLSWTRRTEISKAQ